MKTISLKTAALLLLAAGCCACGKNNEKCSCEESRERHDYIALPSPIKIEGTSWKLAGIMDVETCKLRELEPKDCGNCFTLTFDTDSTAKGKSVMNEIRLQFLPKLFMTVPTYAYDHEVGDVQLFYDAMKTITSCTVTENELKFCCNEGKNYLLFKKKIFVSLY
jgi:hypothetical protein